MELGGLVFVAIVFGLIMIFAGTKGKEKWGINLGTVTCPRCKTPQPKARTPQNTRQALWGGSTCVCGCEMDKWGREVAPSNPAPQTGTSGAPGTGSGTAHFCGNCGARIATNVRFCTSCGTPSPQAQ